MDFFKPQTQQASLRFGHKKILQLPSAIAGFGDRDRIRTCDRLLRRQMLYPAELRDPTQKSISLKGCEISILFSTIKY
jgi:hypothetical protein